jgi:hypothetical protein
MQSDATTPAAYIAEMPEGRRKAISAVRKVIRVALDVIAEAVSRVSVEDHIKAYEKSRR